MRHLTECVVVTAPHDERTQRLCASVPCVRTHVTDAFYRHGAKFNKGLAMEEGFDVLGRRGFILVHDADILLPDDMPLPELRPDRLYSALRVFIDDPRQWHPGFDWRRAGQQGEHVPAAGYFQLFHASDKHISRRPWYDTTFTHAGGGDGYFQSRWPPWDVELLSFKVLHLGPRDTNWFGRVTPRRNGTLDAEGARRANDEMSKYLSFKGWRGHRGAPPDYSERVDVPGHKPSGFTP